MTFVLVGATTDVPATAMPSEPGTVVLPVDSEPLLRCGSTDVYSATCDNHVCQILGWRSGSRLLQMLPLAWNYVAEQLRSSSPNHRWQRRCAECWPMWGLLWHV